MEPALGRRTLLAARDLLNGTAVHAAAPSREHLSEFVGRTPPPLIPGSIDGRTALPAAAAPAKSGTGGRPRAPRNPAVPASRNPVIPCRLAIGRLVCRWPCSYSACGVIRARIGLCCGTTGSRRCGRGHDVSGHLHPSTRGQFVTVTVLRALRQRGGSAGRRYDGNTGERGSGGLYRECADDGVASCGRDGGIAGLRARGVAVIWSARWRGVGSAGRRDCEGRGALGATSPPRVGKPVGRCRGVAECQEAGEAGARDDGTTGLR